MLYRLSKERERRTHDLDQGKFIKYEDRKVLVEGALIRRKWQTYFHKLMNEEGDNVIELGDLEHLERYRDRGYFRCVGIEEV